MNYEEEKEQNKKSVAVYKDEKGKKKLSFFNGFDDFKINYSFSSSNCSNKIKKEVDRNDNGKEDDIKNLIRIINNNYIDKHFYFKKLSMNDLYKIFAYSNFLTKSLILYPSLIFHFEKIIEKFKKIKYESYLSTEDHLRFCCSNINENDQDIKKKFNGENMISYDSNLIKNESSSDNAGNMYFSNKEGISFSSNVTTPNGIKERIKNLAIIQDEKENLINELNNKNNIFKKEGINGRNKKENMLNVSRDIDKNFDYILNKKFEQTNSFSNYLKHDIPSNYEYKQINTQDNFHNIGLNMNNAYDINNIYSKEICNRYNTNNLNHPSNNMQNEVNNNNANVTNSSVDKNVHVYKNINEYDIIELKICTTFNNKYICRYIGIHSGMTLYNIHRCICICLGVKKEDTDNYLHVFILNNGNIYGSGKKCSVSIIRKIQINTDRHITFKHIIKTPLYLYKTKDSNKNDMKDEFTMNNEKVFDNTMFNNDENNFNNLNNLNEINNISLNNINLNSINLSNINLNNIENFNISNNMHEFNEVNNMNNYGGLNYTRNINNIKNYNNAKNLNNLNNNLYNDLSNNLSNNLNNFNNICFNNNNICNDYNMNYLNEMGINEIFTDNIHKNNINVNMNSEAINRNCSYNSNINNINLNNVPAQNKNLGENNSSHNYIFNKNVSNLELEKKKKNKQ